MGMGEAARRAPYPGETGRLVEQQGNAAHTRQ